MKTWLILKRLAAEAPGLIGTLQINARVPGGFVPTGILPVVLSVVWAPAHQESTRTG